MSVPLAATSLVGDAGVSLWWEAMRALLVLLLLLPLAYLATRLVGRRGLPGGAGRLLRLVEIQPLGPGKSLALVEVGESMLLLGITPQQVQLLKEISDPKELAALRRAHGGEGRSSRFADLLGRRINSSEDDPE